MTPIEPERELLAIVRANAWLMNVLQTARDCDPPDWLVGAGAIRSVVWDHLHGHAEPTPLKDVDLVFFDPADLSVEREAAVERQLTARRPDVPWEATNQAAVHLWYHEVFHRPNPVPPFASVEEAVATWPETATSIGLRLLPNDDLLLVAPFGLDDLFNLVLRRNPRRVTLEEFRRRAAEKQIRQKWPRVRVIDG
jgi:hypothetical protein